MGHHLYKLRSPLTPTRSPMTTTKCFHWPNSHSYANEVAWHISCTAKIPNNQNETHHHAETLSWVATYRNWGHPLPLQGHQWPPLNAFTHQIHIPMLQWGALTHIMHMQLLNPNNQNETHEHAENLPWVTTYTNCGHHLPLQAHQWLLLYALTDRIHIPLLHWGAFT